MLHPHFKFPYYSYDDIYNQHPLRGIIFHMFVDEVTIVVQAGKGGSGLVSFRREKYLPFGGPDGGDGGKGGDVFLHASSDIRDLASFRPKKLFKAEDGRNGGSQKMHGADARDLFIDVPVGSIAYVKQEGKELVIADLQRSGRKVMAAKGGRGGLGNVHFATSTRKAPREAQPGEDGERHNIILKLRLMVDVAIIGLPNSGKSTLLSALTGAKPEIAEYTFTTREPVLGMVESDLRSYVWSEMPAIIKNAHEGRGLGNHFLCHAERAMVLLYLVDGCRPDIRDNLNDLLREVELFSVELVKKNSVIAINKIDTFIDSSELDNIKQELNACGLPLFFISAKDRRGLSELIAAVNNIVDDEQAKRVAKSEPEVVYRPKPVDRKRLA